MNELRRRLRTGSLVAVATVAATTLTAAACGGASDIDPGAGDGGAESGADGVADSGPDTSHDGASDASSREPAVHRPTADGCPAVPPVVPEPTVFDGSPAGACSRHADCTAGRNGRCKQGRGGTYCDYDTCVEDRDCPGNTVCECDFRSASGPDVCLPKGNCHVDSDCGEGAYCSPSLGSCGDYSGRVGWFCHRPDDECVDDADCAGDAGSVPRPYCAFEPTVGRWKCSTAQCVG
ncbi:MAG: hypothetical protein U0169_06960 [Polyangiaceae bacterium]